MCIYLEEYSVITNIVLIIITGSLAFYTYRLYSASQKSLKQQGKYYEATRPFVTFDDMVGPIKIETSSMSFTFKIKNFSNSPAKDVQLEKKYFPQKNPILKRI